MVSNVTMKTKIRSFPELNNVTDTVSLSKLGRKAKYFPLERLVTCYSRLRLGLPSGLFH
jgi:hypothetical protein